MARPSPNAKNKGQSYVCRWQHFATVDELCVVCVHCVNALSKSRSKMNQRTKRLGHSTHFI